MNGKVILRAEHIVKEFPGVKALNDVQLALREGEVHALCGENGAGKSTLLKVITGIYSKNGGQIYMDDQPVEINTIQDARKHGIHVVPQEMMMAPHLTVAENIFMGRYPKNKFGAVDWKKMYRDAKKLQEKLGENAAKIDVRANVDTLSMGHKQMIEIMRGLIDENIRVIAFDEPTASLSEEEVEQLFRIIADLKKKNLSIVYVSHKLKEVFSICDTVTVLKDGTYVDTKSLSEITNDDLVQMMVGRDVDLFGLKRDRSKITDKVALEAKDLTIEGKFSDINFHVKYGEILSFYGLIGAGRTEIMRALFGLDPIEKGSVWINEKQVHLRNPKQAVKMGLGFITEDRRGEGLMLDDTIRRNISMPNLNAVLTKAGLISSKMEAGYAKKGIESFRIKTPTDAAYAGNLSGGNQQKVIIAKWVQADCDIIIFDEPTRGIDVGAKAEVYETMKQLADSGKAIIMVSSELPEVLGVSDRVIVMREGKITAEMDNVNLSEENVIKYAVTV